MEDNVIPFATFLSGIVLGLVIMVIFMILIGISCKRSLHEPNEKK
jgi:tetrahydromethanopterin S-methyltransferase subunit B